MPDEPVTRPSRGENALAVVLFGVLLGFSVWGFSVGWRSGALFGNEFRQTQTAMTALFMQREHNFSLAYPTPVLGKPWSIPFEFPLYQWAVVRLSDATGLPLVQAARVVSVSCFYLALPAAWLLLGRLRLGWRGRLIVLGLLLTCPVHIYYGRAFLIETMALMFSLWFLHAFVTAVEQRSWWWLAVANVAGLGAGLVKVTTFMLYLMPAGIWAATWFWRARPRRDGTEKRWTALGRTAGWIAAGTIVPFAATWAWIHYSDAVKTLNPAGRFLTSEKLRGFNFGTTETRFSAEIWSGHWNFITGSLTSLTILAVLAVVALVRSGRWSRWSGWCVGLFAAVQVLFPVLYGFHDYYYMANATLLMTAMGLVLCDLLESPLPRWSVWAIVLGVYGAQIGTYFHTYYPGQRMMLGGTDLTTALREITRPDDVLVIAGEDWSSIMPYYAQRRAMMVAHFLVDDQPATEQCFRRLQGEPVAALVMRGKERGNRNLLELACRYFGFEKQPLFTWKDNDVYVHPRVREAALNILLVRAYDGLTLSADAAALQERWLRHEIPVSLLPPSLAAIFEDMSPKPIRIYTSFGLSVSRDDQRGLISAHPDSRFWFKVPAGRRELFAEYMIYPGAYEDVPANEATDGVEFTVYEVRAGGDRRVLFQRLLNPREVPADRGLQTLNATADIAAGSEVMFETGPGPRRQYSRDWAVWGRIRIK
jgi:hypothetical protein